MEAQMQALEKRMEEQSQKADHKFDELLKMMQTMQHNSSSEQSSPNSPQFSQTNPRPLSYFPKLEFPKFDGHHPRVWIKKCSGVGGTTLVVTQYIALFNNIIHRLRFPKFMAIVSKDPCKEGLAIVEGLLQHGRLTLTQILDRALASSNEGSRDTHRENFIKLVRSRLVERCPAAEPLIPLPTEEENKKKGGGRSAGIFRKEVTLEERALAAAIPMDAERFSLNSDYGVDSDVEKNENSHPAAKAGDKRKQDSLEWDSESDITGAKKEPVWRVNFDEFINRLRIKACVEYARAEYDNVAAVILHSMLEGTKCTDSTVFMSLDSIFEEVIKREEGLTMNLERLRCSLEQLDFCSDVDDGYSINMEAIIKKAQLEEVESIVKRRHGVEAFRMFRLLSEGRALDTEKISERTFVDKKNTPRVLYKLWTDNYIQMEKISTGGPRHTDYFMWSLKKNHLWHQVLDEMYHAALNLSMRYAHEVDQDREIQNVVKENPEVVKRRTRLKKVRILLDSSLMKLDDAVLLFHDFVLNTPDSSL